MSRADQVNENISKLCKCLHPWRKHRTGGDLSCQMCGCTKFEEQSQELIRGAGAKEGGQPAEQPKRESPEPLKWKDDE